MPAHAPFRELRQLPRRIFDDGDVDWMVVFASAGRTLEAETFNLEGSNPDTVLEVYDNAGAMVASNDDLFSLASLVTWPATYTGTYFLKARTYGGEYGHFDDQGGGPAECSYEVVLNTGVAACDIDGNGILNRADLNLLRASCGGCSQQTVRQFVMGCRP